MSVHRLLRRRLAWLPLLGLLGGCAGTLPADLAPPTVEVTPPRLQQHKPAVLTVKLDPPAAPGTRMTLVPAGPYVSHSLPLSVPPSALVSDGRRAFVAGDRELLVVDFPDSRPARVLARVSGLPAAVTSLALGTRQLLMALADGQLLLMDIAQPGVPTVVARYRAGAPVRDLQFEAGRFHLLTGDGELLSLRVDTGSGGEPSLREHGRWRLPTPATALAVRGTRVWLAGPQGLSVLALDAQRARPLDRFSRLGASHGEARDIQLHGDLALLDAGPGGLVVFDISDPDRLRWTGSFSKRGAIRGMSLQPEADAVLVSLDGGTVLSLGLHNPELPDSGAAYRAPGPVQAMAAAGPALLVASTGGLQRVIMGDEHTAAISPEGVNLGGSRRGVIRDDILYVADWFSGLHLYDISLPRQPRHLGNYHTPGSSKGVTLMGDYALVGDDDQGLQIIDIADPRHPAWVSELPPQAMSGIGLAYTMKRLGTRLYLADHRGGFHIIDLSDIHQPRRLGGVDTRGKSWAIDVRVRGDRHIAFVADDSSGLLVFDVSDPGAIRQLGAFDPGGQAEDVVLRGDLAYVAFFDRGFYVLDVSKPSRPRQRGHVAIPGNARGIALAGDRAYVAGWESGLQVLDIGDPSAPRIVGAYDTDGAAWGVNVRGDTAYLLDWWGGIKVLDIREPERPALLARYHARGTLRRLRVRGNYLYAASGAGGVQVFDIRNPLNPIWARGLDLEGDSQDLWLEDDRGYVAGGDAGIAILDTLDPFYARQIGVIDTPGEAYLVRAYNEYLYLADRRAGLLVWDVREPRRPRRVAQYELWPRDLWLDEQGLWVATADGISQWALADDGRPRRLWQRAMGGVTLIRSREGLLATARRRETGDGLVELWRSGPGGIQPLARYRASGEVLDLQFAADGLQVLTAGGLTVLGLDGAGALWPSVHYPSTGAATGMASVNGAVFFSGATAMASVQLLPPVAIRADAADRFTMALPEGLPRGDYHLRFTTPDGAGWTRSRALSVSLQAPNKRRFGLEAFRRLLKTPLKPPSEP